MTFVAPKFVSANRPYNVYVRTSHLEHPIFLAMMFREQRVTKTLIGNSNNFVPATFDQGGREFSTNSSFDYKILMKHNDKCHEKVFNISRNVKKSYIFVQLDKPIYKPGDEIKFRIISLNNTLQPFKPDNVNVTLYNPKGAFTQDRDNLKNVNGLGLFNETFFLPDNAEEGKWSIFIRIGRVNTTKTFTVQKYTLPFYEFKMHTRPKVGLDEKNLLVDIEAVYSFGGFIKGNVNIQVSSISGVISRNALIDNNHCFNLSLENDLGLSHLPDGMVILNVTATFKDHLDLFTHIKTRLIEVYPKKKCDIEIIHLQNYTVGVPYEFNVIVKDFEGNIITKSSSPVQAKFINHKRGCTHNEIRNENIENSVASFRIENPKVCEGENLLEISFNNKFCQKRYNVLKESGDVLKRLILRSAPQK